MVGHGFYTVHFGAWALCLGATAVLVNPVAADEPISPRRDLQLIRSDASGQVTFLRAPAGQPLSVRAGIGRAEATPLDFLMQYGSLLGVRDVHAELQEFQVTTDRLGGRRTAYRQVYRGVPVYSGIIYVHQNALGEFVAANGHFHPLKSPLNMNPTLNATQAEVIARRSVEANELQTETVTLVVVDPGWYGDPSMGAHLAWHVIVVGAAAPVRESFFVDAHSGEILDQWSLICTARQRFVRSSRRGSDCCVQHDERNCDDADCAALTCDFDPTCCDSQWHTRCMIIAFNFCFELCAPGGLVRAEGEPPSDVSDVDAIYDYLGDTYDYFFRAFGRDGVDGKGLAMTASAEWPFFCPNAFWDGFHQFFGFCRGTAADDVVAHEVVHAITDFTANLIGQNQPGQLNESFSDIFGELVDLHNGNAAFVGPLGPPVWPEHETGPGLDSANYFRSRCSRRVGRFTDGVRWLIGEDAAAFGAPIRDMWDPTCLDDPDRANSPLQDCDVVDSGGVHSGSGVPNHAFALVTDGGTFNGYTIEAIGPIKAGAVWYRALTTYLTLASDFADAYVGLNQSALDLIGTFPNDPATGLPTQDRFTAEDAEQIDKALLAVELNTQGRCGQNSPVLKSDTPFQCNSSMVVFADNFEGGPNGWSVENTQPTTPYDWEQVGSLPFGREGRAWFIDNGRGLTCADTDEAAVHSLISPPIELPNAPGFPYLAFTHYLQTEPAYDGGTLRIRVNGGDWQDPSPQAFEFNAYNSLLRNVEFYRNTNPLAGQPAWTGLGGRWGTSVVSLNELAEPGDTIQIRFDFGKDHCVGSDGWYVDDVSVYVCPDCNQNGTSDHRELMFLFSSGASARIGSLLARTIELFGMPEAVSDVLMSVSVLGDFSRENEYLTFLLDGTELNRFFVDGATDCPFTPDEQTLIIPVDLFNAALRGGRADLDFLPSEAVNTGLCGGTSFYHIFLQYEQAFDDDNGNQIPDECEGCIVSDAPLGETDPLAKPRYLTFVPVDTQRHLAYRVTRTSNPEGTALVSGTSMWIGVPRSLSERSDLSNASPPAVRAASLECEPVYREWNTLDTIHVSGSMIVPDSTYAIQAIDLPCDLGDEASFSLPVLIHTSPWGDILGRCDVTGCAPPDGRVDITTDVTAVVDKYSNLEFAISKVRTDLGGAVPDHIVDMGDITLALDAFLGKDYPFSGATGCLQAKAASADPTGR